MGKQRKPHTGALAAVSVSHSQSLFQISHADSSFREQTRTSADTSGPPPLFEGARFSRCSRELRRHASACTVRIPADVKCALQDSIHILTCLQHHTAQYFAAPPVLVPANHPACRCGTQAESAALIHYCCMVFHYSCNVLIGSLCASAACCLAYWSSAHTPLPLLRQESALPRQSEAGAFSPPG